MTAQYPEIYPLQSLSHVKMERDVIQKVIHIDSKHTGGKQPSQAFWLLSPRLHQIDAGIESSPLWPAGVETENKWIEIFRSNQFLFYGWFFFFLFICCFFHCTSLQQSFLFVLHLIASKKKW